MSPSTTLRFIGPSSFHTQVTSEPFRPTKTIRILVQFPIIELLFVVTTRSRVTVFTGRTPPTSRSVRRKPRPPLLHLSGRWILLWRRRHTRLVPLNMVMNLVIVMVADPFTLIKEKYLRKSASSNDVTLPFIRN